MQIKSSNDGLLTNYEVLDLIKERKAQRDYWRKDTIHLQPRIALENKVNSCMYSSCILIANQNLYYRYKHI